MRFGIVVFPGSNCDHDAYHSVKHVLGEEASFLWHKDTDLQGVDIVILPGGFSYGDYLRCGAIARFSPITDAIRRHAEEGGLVMGICNGFQILQEMRLLPGVMLPNSGLKFVCRHVHLRAESEETPFSNQCRKGQVLKLPVAHHDGNFFVPPEELEELEKNGQILFRYVDKKGVPTAESNPNGSIENIAAVVNRERNVLGIMPHPERAVERLLGSDDGLKIFHSVIHAMNSVSARA